jgi:hypothetical protein
MAPGAPRLMLMSGSLGRRAVTLPRQPWSIGAPFTDFDRNGVEGVFEKSDVVRLVQILRQIEPRFAA